MEGDQLGPTPGSSTPVLVVPNLLKRSETVRCPLLADAMSNQLGIYELEQYSIIRMLSKCFWVAGSFQEGGGSVRDTDPLAADHCSSCVATEMESMFTLDPSTCKMEYR
jgi:hypothetical protein